MCEPTTIAMGVGAAAMAGGALMKNQGQNASAKAVAGRMNDESGRQSVFRNAAAGAWDKTIAGMEKPKTEAGLADAQAKSTTALQSNVTNFSAAPAEGVGRAPKVITDAYEGGANASRGYGLDYAARTGAMEGFGNQLFSRNIDIGRGRQEIDKWGNFSRGSQSVLPMEVDAASKKGDSQKGMGELFSGLGNLAMMFGLSGTPAAAPVSTAGALKSAGTIPGIGRIR